MTFTGALAGSLRLVCGAGRGISESVISLTRGSFAGFVEIDASAGICCRFACAGGVAKSWNLELISDMKSNTYSAQFKQKAVLAHLSLSLIVHSYGVWLAKRVPRVLLFVYLECTLLLHIRNGLSASLTQDAASLLRHR